MRRARFVVLALVLFACRHHETPTSPTSSGCGPVMGALGDVNVTGRVTTADGRPSAGARVVFHNLQGNFFEGAITDSNGVFRRSGAFSHGRYMIYVYPPGEASPALNRLTELACGDNVVDLVIPSIRCTYVTGIVSAGYSRVRDARVAFAGATASTSGDGQYVLNIGCPPTFAGSPSPFTVGHPDYKPYSAAITIPETSISLDVTLVPK